MKFNGNRNDVDKNVIRIWLAEVNLKENRNSLYRSFILIHWKTLSLSM